MNLLSSKHRKSVLESVVTKEFDLVVIGGGVTGAGIALDAANRGLSVLLLEKNDFASGTSSRSTKLIHGGLRYLKQFEFALVREVGMERAIVHRLAPHLVIPEKMLMPLIEGGTYGKLGTSFGLKVYDILAQVEGDDRRVMLDREETIKQEPNLNTNGLKGSGYYAEYRTDDARLTIELIKTAAEYGAISLNYVKAENFLYDESKMVCGIKALDMNSNQSFEIKSKYVVSAAGPWVDKLRKINNSLKGKHLFHSKGVHIVVPRERLPLNDTIYFDIPDGRMLFAIPRQRITYIGTTDTPYKDDLNHVLTNTEDVEYLLEGANSMFPNANLVIEDVESSWAGIRPLIHEEGKSASEISRKDEIFESETGLISIAGGKLTGYRKMSERIVDLVVKKFKQNQEQTFKDSNTKNIPLAGGHFSTYTEVENYMQTVAIQIREWGLDAYFTEYLVSNYGQQAGIILAFAKSYLDENPNTLIALTRAEFQFCVENELVLSAIDFYARRTGRLYFDIGTIEPTLGAVLQDGKAYFNWDDKKVKAEKEIMEAAVKEASQFEYSKDHATT